jgi:hypothetical protein
MRPPTRRFKQACNLGIMCCTLLIALWWASRNWEVRWTSPDALTTYMAFEGRLKKVYWHPEKDRSFPPRQEPYCQPGWDFVPAVFNTKIMWLEVHANNSQADVIQLFDARPFVLSRFLLFALATLIVASMILTFRTRRKPPPGHCQTCGYNLTGNKSGKCSECGKPIPESQRKLLSEPSPGATSQH